jgi:hypothetical protein
MALIQRDYAIVWSPKSFKSYEVILHYIEEKFDSHAVEKFVKTIVR